MPDKADERRHRPGPGPWWTEWWELVFWAGDASVAGSVRLTLLPGAGRAWFWADLVGVDRPLVAARDDEVELPRSGSLEVRAEGLWSALTCETPLEHWSVGLEAFAVALEEPDEAMGQARGVRVPMGVDLEWEAAGAARDTPPLGLAPGGRRYEQAATVHGDVLVGEERVALSGRGWRVRGWGDADWSTPWSWAATGATGPPGARIEPWLRAPVEVRDAGQSALGVLERGLGRVRGGDGSEETAWAESYRPGPHGVSPGAPRQAPANGPGRG